MKSKPNILWIVADHQVHATRPAGFDQFPLQKKLKRLGTEFTRAYSVLPICSPARASMLTGLYPHAHGLTENDGRFGGRAGLELDDWMIHRPLQESGFRCGWFGKWHVDNRFSAIDYGFEGFSLPGYGYPYESDAYQEYRQRNALPQPEAQVMVRNETGLTEGTVINLSANTDWFNCVSGVAKLNGPTELHEAAMMVDLASRWIDSIGDDRFFMRVDPWGPHPPYLLSEEFAGCLDAENIELPESFDADLCGRPDHHRDYQQFWQDSVGLDREEWRRQYQYALEHIIMVETILSRLLERVDLENTLVIFNSDHGDAVGSNGGVANKGDLMVEATMQIPLLMAGAGVSSDERRDQLVSSMDIAPTLLELCGLEPRSKLQGNSLMPLLEQPSKWERSGLMTQHYGLQEPVVQRAWYRDHYKLVVGQNGFFELYDLQSDPEELRNLARNSSFTEVFRRMREELLSSMQQMADSHPGILSVLQSD